MRKIKLSNRARNTPPSPIRKLAHLASRAKAEGVRVYHLNIGQPDLPSPKEFFEGLKLFDEPVLAYDQSQGNAELCNAWSKHMNGLHQLSTTPEQFLITMGASEALVFLFMTCCDPGDEVVIFDPTYANYIGFAAVAGVNLIPVLSNIEEGFALPPLTEIEARFTNRTRAILLCNPNNPTGTVYSRAEIEALLRLCEEHNIFLIVDETYREFVFDGINPLSILHLAADNPRVIVVDSLSKRYSLCGARLGCLLTPNEEVLATTLNLAQARLSAPTLEQFAAAYMLEHISEDYLPSIRDEYQARRDLLYQSMSGIDDIVVHRSQGAFYTIAKLPVEDAEQFASYLLSEFRQQNSTVFVAPASGFYMQNAKGKQKIRIAYVLEDEQIKESVSIIRSALDSYPGRTALC